MPSSQELLEADGYRRRRLLAAMVRGRPDADALPSELGRILGGIVLAGLLIAGAVVTEVMGQDSGADEPTPAEHSHAAD